MDKKPVFLYGRRSVGERLRVHPQSIRKVYIDDVFEDNSLLKRARAHDIPVIRLNRREFYNKKHFENAQGIMAESEPFRYTLLDELFGQCAKEKLTLILLDEITDPQNLGSIIRTTACLGNFGIVIPKHNSCGITETVLHVACGGENYVPVAMANLSIVISEAKKMGYTIVGAVVEEGEPIGTAEFVFPLCLVIGSEGEGIRQGLLNQLDQKVRLSMQGAELSFNVSVATALFCYEISRQKGQA